MCASPRLVATTPGAAAPGPTWTSWRRSSSSKKAEADAKAAAEAAAAKAAAEQQAAEEAAAAGGRRRSRGTGRGGGTTVRDGRLPAAATLGEGGGYYTAIVGAHRHITTRVDDLAWTQALQHYKATTGEMPKNHEEFMRVMTEGGVPLPEMEQGQEYLLGSERRRLGNALYRRA